MARPQKTNADYFSHDTGMRNDLKIKAIRRKFGLEGYAIWCMMLEVLTDSDNLELEYNETELELISADFDIDAEKLKAIIDYCVSPLRILAVENGFLFSETLKKRLDSLFQKRKRQQKIVIDVDNSKKYEFTNVLAVDNTHSKVKESKVNKIKVNESKENTNSEENQLVFFENTDIHFSILEFFGFTEMRNPDKLQQISIFLNILFTDGRINQFTDQFEAYRLYKEKSSTAKHSFPRFLGTIETRYLDGGWNQENWTDRLNAIAKRESSDSPFNSEKTQSLRERIVNGKD
ncbi:MAG TPA: DUF4373 domain-containing protein [Paludibacteraceae bacterium]|nr:DUF4373 domain-containing protein [Paludibacteraceae bacterium]